MGLITCQLVKIRDKIYMQLTIIIQINPLKPAKNDMNQLMYPLITTKIKIYSQPL